MVTKFSNFVKWRQSHDRVPLPLFHKDEEREWKDLMKFSREFYPFMKRTGKYSYEFTVSMDLFVDTAEEGEENFIPWLVTHRLDKCVQQNKFQNEFTDVLSRNSLQKEFLEKYNGPLEESPEKSSSSLQHIEQEKTTTNATTPPPTTSTTTTRTTHTNQ